MTLPASINSSRYVMLPYLSYAYTDFQPICTFYVPCTNKQMKTCLSALLQGPLYYWRL